MRIGLWNTGPAVSSTAGRLHGGFRTRLDPARMRAGRNAGLKVIAAWPALAALGCISALAAAALPPSGERDPTLRATLETLTAVAALIAAASLTDHFRQCARRRDLLMLCGVGALGAVDLISEAGPVLLRPASTQPVAAAPAIVTFLAAGCFVAGAHAAAKRPLASGRSWEPIAFGAAAATAAFALLASWLLGDLIISADEHGNSRLASVISHPAALPVIVGGMILMALAAVRFAADLDKPAGSGAFAAATVLLAVDLLLNVARAQPAPGAVSIEALIRLAAFGLLAAGALRQSSARRRDAALAMAAQERHRLAQDLHDGLCQDLAFIASQGAQIAGQHGDDHPLAVAARRALAASRGALHDLSASDAMDVRQALRSVGDELSLRFGIFIDVRSAPIELAPAQREGIVRIVREAIVNAASHGAARNVKVLLQREDGALILCVQDDGRGIHRPPRRREGFGMTSMRERAAALGGRLEVREGDRGGTELELVIP
ncbi:MAG: sensor histidine kinase [Solirubrobacteraceae bacterium]